MSCNSRSVTSYLLTTCNSSNFLKGNNLVTTRPNNIYCDQPSINPAKSIGEASMITRRLYKRACRMVV